MSHTVAQMSESELAVHLPHLIKPLGLRMEIPLGQYRIDAIAVDAEAQQLVIIELKVARSKDALAQLLLYRRAVRNRVQSRPDAPQNIQSILITTYLDSNVPETIQELGLADQIKVKVCVEDSAGLPLLVDPENELAKPYVHDQASDLSGLDAIEFK